MNYFANSIFFLFEKSKKAKIDFPLLLIESLTDDFEPEKK